MKTKRFEDILIVDYGNVYIVNPDSNDSQICKTIKSQYYKNGITNIFYGGGHIWMYWNNSKKKVKK